jgi:hypothetical protein
VILNPVLFIIKYKHLIFTPVIPTALANLELNANIHLFALAPWKCSTVKALKINASLHNFTNFVSRLF